jgi:hypothetical protein
MGWSTIQNGELLALAANLSELAIAVVVLRARTNRLADLRPLVPNLLVALPRAKPGTATVVEP